MKVAVLIDGGHLRALALRSATRYDAGFVEQLAFRCLDADETLFRALYYDCAPYVGTVRLPVSGDERRLEGGDAMLRHLAERDLFAVREGILKFRGFKPRRTPIPGQLLTDDDFRPDFEQKGVDMRIGLDIANLANKKIVERIVLVTADTDFVPAMKYARIEGMQVVLIEFEKQALSRELLWHSDFKRRLAWPA
jgi:uncharacterized LabA/DUF88 family protein